MTAMTQMMEILDTDSPIVLEENDSLWRFLELSPDAIVVYVERQITKANQAALQLMGAKSLEELQGRSILSFVSPEFRRIAHERIRLVEENKQAVPIIEEKLIRLDGELITVELYSVPAVYSGETAAITIIRDVTEPRNMARQLQKAVAEAQAASQAKTDFFAKMSHELRTPLHGTMGMLELLFESSPTPEQLEYLGLAFNSTQALLAVVSDLLDISSIEAGQISLSEILFDIEHMLRTLLQTLEPKAHQKGIPLELHYTAPHLIKGDPIRIWQTFSNLINNAIKFTERGKIKVGVDCRHATEKELELLFAVKDTGVGIPEDQMDQIFEPFYQFDIREERYHEGTGLGLTICQQLVDLMGGKLRVESRLGVGSTFSVRLALPRPTKDEVQHHLREGKWWWPRTELPRRYWPSPHDTEGNAPPARILVAEDNLVNQRLMRNMLSSYNYRVDIVGNGELAIDCAQKIPYNLVLMDIQMPGIDGLEATRAIRSDEESASQHSPIVAVTAFAMPEDRERCLNAGMDGYLSKPVQRHSLEEVLQRYINMEDEEYDDREGMQ